jgi:hypothetical protein
MSTTFTCPECRSILKSANPILAGKKIKCPKCQKIFAAPATNPGRSEAIQAKPSGPAAAPRKLAPEEDLPVAEIEGTDDWEVLDEEPAAVGAKKRKPSDDWEVVDEEPETAPAGRKARKSRAAADEDDEEAEEDREDEDEDLSRRHARRKQKSKSSGKGLVIGLVSGGVLLLLLGGGSFGVYWYLNKDKNRGTGKELLLAYVPADSTVVTGLDVALLMNVPPAAAQIEQVAKQGAWSNLLAECKKSTDLEFRDFVLSAVFAIKVSDDPQGGVQYQTCIFKSRIPFDQNRIRDSAKDAKSQKFKGKTYFAVNDPKFPKLFMPSDRILIVTNLPDAQMQNLVVADGTQPVLAAEPLALVREAERDMFWAVLSLDPSKRQQMQQGFQAAAGPAMLFAPELKTLVEPITQSKAASFSAALDGGSVRLDLRLACANEASAKQIVGGVQSIWNRFKGMSALGGLANIFTGKKEDKPEDALLKELKQNTQFSNEGPLAHATTKLTFQSLQSGFQAFQQAAMMQQQGGVPQGGFPGGNPGMARPRGGFPGVP